MKRGLALSVVAVLAGLVANIPTASARTQAGSAAQKPLGYKLADRVLSEKNLARSVKATRQILALSGVATVREGQEIVPGVAPLSRWKMTARETVYMTLGARNPQVSLGIMAKKMSKAGVEAGYGSWEEYFPGMVRDWLQAAGPRMNDPLSQPALFLQRMQAKHPSKVSIFDRESDPAKMVLSSLEATLVLANLERVIKPGIPPEEVEAPPEPEEEYDEEEEPYRASASQDALSGGPCGAVKSALDSLGPIASGAADVVIGDATGSVLEAYSDSLKDGAGDKVGKALTALDLADRLWRTYGFSQHVQVKVFVADANGNPLPGDRVHKPTNGDRKDVFFVADVGLDDEKRKELEDQLAVAKDQAFQESMRACAELHGITIPKSPYGDLAEEMEGWFARWTQKWGGNDVVARPPLRGRLKRIDFASAGSLFRVSVDDEPRKSHNKKFTEYVSEHVALVEISAQKPPSPVAMAKLAQAIATGGAAGDFVGPIAELLEGMFRTVAKPIGTGKLLVEEHMKNPCLNFRDEGGNGARASC